MYVCLYVCLSLCLSVCLSVCMSVCLYVNVSVCLFFCLSICLSVCMYVCLYVCLSVCLCVCLSDISRLFRTVFKLFVILVLSPARFQNGGRLQARTFCCYWLVTFIRCSSRWGVAILFSYLYCGESLKSTDMMLNYKHDKMECTVGSSKVCEDNVLNQADSSEWCCMWNEKFDLLGIGVILLHRCIPRFSNWCSC